MKQNICPYLDSQNRCTHKLPKIQKYMNKRLPDCVFLKANKCELYNYWLEQIKSIRKLENASDKALRKELGL